MKKNETKSETIIVDIPLQASNIDERGNVLYLDEDSASLIPELI